MNEYEKIARETRKEISKITAEQQREVLKIYKSSIEDMSERIAKTRKGTLSERWLVDYQKELKTTRKGLNTELNKSIKGYTTKAARVATEAEKGNLVNMFESGGLSLGETFTGMFSGVQNNIVNDIVKGNLYKDNKTLSGRIWNHSKEFEKDIQYVINQAILEKKSAIDLASDLEQFVKPKSKRDTTWGKSYPNLRNKRVEYNSMRLARTSINHAYQTATIQSASLNPFIEGIEWMSANIHGRTCELCMERDGTIYNVNDVPLDHANGLCTMIPISTKSLDDVAKEIKGWIDGDNNPMLDDWYDKYGDMFSGVKNITKGIVAKEVKTKTVFSESEVEDSLLNDVKFDNISKSFEIMDADLKVSTTNQLIKLEDKFGAINRSTHIDIAVDIKSGANASVNTAIYDPTVQTLSFNKTKYISKDVVIESAKESIDTGWSMPINLIEEELKVYTTTHEYGHILQNVLVKDEYVKAGWTKATETDFINIKAKTEKAQFRWYTSKRAKVEKDNYIEIIEIAKKNNPDFDLEKNISGYGKTDRAEFFAEVFANSQLGAPNELGNAMNVWLVDKGLIVR